MFGALPAEVFGIGLVFTRIGALVMMLPGIGDASVPPRIRLSLALVLALAFYPIVRAGLPATPPATVGDMGGMVLVEIFIGLGLGALMRMFLSALSVAGEAISMQTTLSFAQSANPGLPPTTTVGAFLTLLGVTLLFATGLHQLFIGAMVKSYTLFPIGRGFPLQDMSQLAIRTFGDTFALGIQLAAPAIVFSLVFNIAAGFIGRVMPQFQIFFVATPLAVLLGLSLLAMSLGVLGLVWIDRFRTFLSAFA